LAPAPAIVPAERVTTWNPGIPGGVPSRTVVCANLDAAAYGNGANDATAGIQAALDGCPAGQVVVLSAGTFSISRTLQITKGIVLRGQGPAQTKIVIPVGTNANLITIGTQWFKFTSSTNLAGDAAKGSQAAVLTGNPGLAAGEIVLVDQIHQPRHHRMEQELSAGRRVADLVHAAGGGPGGQICRPRRSLCARGQRRAG
jgi:hypothetical protein